MKFTIYLVYPRLVVARPVILLKERLMSRRPVVTQIGTRDKLDTVKYAHVSCYFVCPRWSRVWNCTGLINSRPRSGNGGAPWRASDIARINSLSSDICIRRTWIGANTGGLYMYNIIFANYIIYMYILFFLVAIVFFSRVYLKSETSRITLPVRVIKSNLEESRTRARAWNEVNRSSYVYLFNFAKEILYYISVLQNVFY